MSDLHYRSRIKISGPATLLKDPSNRLIASTHPSPTNDPHLFRYSVQYAYHSLTIYAADQRAAQFFGYHLFKRIHRRIPIHRHLVAVTLLPEPDPCPDPRPSPSPRR